MENEGWVMLHRKVMNHFLWDARPFGKGEAWIDLILLANYKNREGIYGNQRIIYERGTVSRSIVQLADRWGWSRCKVRDFLNMLEREEMVHVEITKGRTVIRLTNYEKYQAFSDTFPTPSREENYPLGSVDPYSVPEAETLQENKHLTENRQVAGRKKAVDQQYSGGCPAGIRYPNSTNNNDNKDEKVKIKKMKQEEGDSERAERLRDFNNFWEAYPKKVDRKKAEEVFLKRRFSGKELEEMLHGLERQKKTGQWTSDGGRFIPNPSTWLKNERWMDDISSVSPCRDNPAAHFSQRSWEEEDSLQEMEEFMRREIRI